MGVSLFVDFKTDRGVVVEYTVVLLWAAPIGTETIRVYDSAHGFNEMHRCTRQGGKRVGTEFHSGSLGEGMRSAIEDIKWSYVEMIEGWDR